MGLVTRSPGVLSLTPSHWSPASMLASDWLFTLTDDVILEMEILERAGASQGLCGDALQSVPVETQLLELVAAVNEAFGDAREAVEAQIEDAEVLEVLELSGAEQRVEVVPELVVTEVDLLQRVLHPIEQPLGQPPHAVVREVHDLEGDVLASEDGTRHRMTDIRTRLLIIFILSSLFICFIISERVSSNKAGSRPPVEYIFVLTF